MQPTIHRKNNFDFLRFVLASMVVLSHSYPLATGSEADEPFVRWTNGQLTMGSFAVDAFFILSGYLISRSWISAPVTRIFLEKRVRRIYPGFIAAAAIGAFVVFPLFSPAGLSGISGEFVVSFIGKALRLLASVPGPAFPDNPAPGAVNGALWSISYEFWCYILVLACGLAGWLQNRRVLWIALILSIANSLMFTITGIHPGGSYLGLVFGYPPFWARLLPLFLAGMAFQASGESIPRNLIGAACCAVSIVAGALIPNGLIVALPIAGAYLLLWFAESEIPKLDGFARRGDFSYGIYLYSFPVLQIAVAVHAGKWAPLALFAVAWPLSILVAIGSWYGVERRFLVKRRTPPLPRAAGDDGLTGLEKSVESVRSSP